MSTAAVDIHELAAEIASLIADRTPPPLLTADQASELLAVPASWLLAQARASRVPHIKLGRYVRFDRAALLDWCEARAVGPRPRKPAK